MRIKINGQDIEKGDRVTFETSDLPTEFGLLIVILGLAIVLWIVTGGVFV